MEFSQDAEPTRGDEQRPPHILAIPFPLMGHMTPLLQLCRMLIAKTGCRVTIVCHERAVPSLRKLLPDDDPFSSSMEVLPIPDGLPLELDPITWEKLRDLMRLYDEGYSRCLQPHMQSRFADVGCVISDVYWSWTQEIAYQLGVPRIAIWVAAAAEFQVYFHAKELITAGKLPFKAPPGIQRGIDNMMPNVQGRPPAYHMTDAICEEMEEIAIVGLPGLNRRDFPVFLQIEDPTDEFFWFFIEHIRTALQAPMVLFNSFEALEGTVIDKLRSQGVCARTIGPLFLLEDVILNNEDVAATNDKSVETSPITQSGGEEHFECLKWLDQHKPKSVIYVAFGTTIDLEGAQLRELALGFLNSGQPFIWAYSGASIASDGDDAIKSALSEGLFKQVKDAGLLLKWAPQKRVLGHPAVGAFLTHCGWNSTLESMSLGVPTLALPFLSDQPLHCKMMVDAWEVGLRLQRSPAQGLVPGHDIACLTRELLTSEKGATLRTKAQGYQIAARSSTQPGGVSHQTLDAIIKLMLNNK